MLPASSIDVSLEPPHNVEEQTKVAQQLKQELSVESRDLEVAFRNTQRYVRTYQPQRVEMVPAGADGLREEGVYLITGGLGGSASSWLSTWRVRGVRSWF